MRTIHKYPISQRPVLIHNGGIFLHFGMQDGQAMAWYEVETLRPQTYRSIRIYGTGQEIPASSKHLATCQDGEFVWHLYEDEN